jgi:predicted phage-related endonuclease
MTIYKFGRVNDKWLELRQKHVTATDLASLFGMNTYMDTDEMIRSKTHKDKLTQQEKRLFQDLEQQRDRHSNGLSTKE